VSAYEVGKFCRDCLRDIELRELAQRDPSKALDRYHLTDGEKSALLAGDVGQLYTLGSSAFLLSYLPRWKIFGLDVESYSERMRAARDQ
jgi:Aromatic-ring-opening dioxygenase LigAB, LigA subunit